MSAASPAQQAMHMPLKGDRKVLRPQGHEIVLHHSSNKPAGESPCTKNAPAKVLSPYICETLGACGSNSTIYWDAEKESCAKKLAGARAQCAPGVLPAPV